MLVCDFFVELSFLSFDQKSVGNLLENEPEHKFFLKQGKRETLAAVPPKEAVAGLRLFR